MSLQERIEFAIDNDISKSDRQQLIKDFLSALNTGSVRSAFRSDSGEWLTNSWVKQGILYCFKSGTLEDKTINMFPFFDKDTLSLREFSLQSGVRIVPGGSAIRNGCYVAPGVICMPPMYINIGSYVDEGTMIDSHALVGTCAQIGKRVHISAAAQIGGVLEPTGAQPVIVEDDVMIGGNCGVYEGVLIRNRAVLGSGVILNASTPVYDLIHEVIYRAAPGKSIEIPEGAVVVSGSRRMNSRFADEHGLNISTPLIVKYRDEKTDARTALESVLR